MANLKMLAFHDYGMGVVKKVVMNASKQETKLELISFLLSNSMNLVCNPYGNYVIQTAVEVCTFKI